MTPPYSYVNYLNNVTLREMQDCLSTSKAELAAVRGMGDSKVVDETPERVYLCSFAFFKIGCFM